VQLTFDENVINNHLQALFNNQKVISLKQTIIGWLPDSVRVYAKAMSNFFTTVWFVRLFPEIVTEFGAGR
jgi:hypothetical protein